MEWYEIKDRIYYVDGTLRDIYVSETTINDWILWKKMVETNYIISVFYGKSNTYLNVIDFSKIVEYWKGNGGFMISAKIDVGSINITCNFFSEGEIETSFDPAQINAITDHNDLMKYIFLTSSILKKQVIVTEESQKNNILMSAFDNKIYFAD